MGDEQMMLPTAFSEDCLGPRGRRKYLVRSESVAFLEVHTPPTWKVYHMGHNSDDASIDHFQGLLSRGADLCGESARSTPCDDAWCQKWQPQAICDTTTQ